MCKKIAIIGGDSFIAGIFYAEFKDVVDFKLFSRKYTGKHNEVVISDLFSLKPDDFIGVDVVINFAAIVHRPEIKEADLYDQINHQLPVFLANQAKGVGVKQFIQISTIAVYGDVEEIDLDTPVNPINDYGESKLKADDELAKLSDDTFKVCSIRPSMVYGGGLAPGNMASLIKLVKIGFPLPFSDVNNSRQFINVHNLTKAIMAIVSDMLEGIVILADEKGVSTSNIITSINMAIGRNDRQIKIPFFWQLVKRLMPSVAHKLTSNLIIKNTYSFKQLGIQSPASFEDGIKEMI